MLRPQQIERYIGAGIRGRVSTEWCGVKNPVNRGEIDTRQIVPGNLTPVLRTPGNVLKIYTPFLQNVCHGFGSATGTQNQCAGGAALPAPPIQPGLQRTLKSNGIGIETSQPACLETNNVNRADGGGRFIEALQIWNNGHFMWNRDIQSP